MSLRAKDSELGLKRIAQLPSDFDDIVRLASSEEFNAMQRMREEWDSGANRFSAPGEALFEARCASRLVGICGLNRDPYAPSSAIGRVRHLYVDPEFRRRGVGRMLVCKVIEEAGRNFDRLRLRTSSAEADSFYEAIGFRRVSEPEATHDWPR